jgi:antitoxin MazE
MRIDAYKLVSTLERGVQMTTAVSVDQTVQEWGNGLAVRITAPVARAARFTRGLPIKVEVVEGGIFLRTAGKPSLTLAQKLKAFDPAVHGGEAMATGRVGAEVF